MKRIILIGGGHRASFYMRTARFLPSEFQVVGAYVRKPERAAAFEAYWGVKAYTDFDRLIEEARADYAIVAVFPEFAPEYIRKLAEAKLPILCETPPGLTLEALNDIQRLVDAGAKIQVSEQYNNAPIHRTRLNVVASGLIGEVSHAQVSVAHDYHGLSMLRNLLGVKYENAKVTAVSLKGKLMDGPTRYNTYVPETEVINPTTQTIAVFDYGDKSGVYDFIGEQYASWVRRQRVLILGSKGQIEDETVRALLDSKTPVEMPLTRMDTHEYDYAYLHGYTLGERWVYKNKYIPCLKPDALSTYYGRIWDFDSTLQRMTDDEIAVADVMTQMNEYVETGRSFYSFGEGAQDQYMQLVINEALATGRTVEMKTQSWAKN
ncbi:MAG: Gfo/Idh/MocA family oxidoreductase [Clostridia bacterium]|nr:Gfo/Idh/MocA family oxidoreductase [Clostridia bacterium]